MNSNYTENIRKHSTFLPDDLNIQNSDPEKLHSLADNNQCKRKWFLPCGSRSSSSEWFLPSSRLEMSII